MNCPNQIRMLELITILSLITLSLSWIQDYPDQITIATDNRLSRTDKRLSESDNNIKYIMARPQPRLRRQQIHTRKMPFTPPPPRCTFSGYLTKFRGSSSHFRFDNFSLQIFTQPVLFRTVVAFVYLFSTVYFQPPQIAVCFQTCPQSACIRGCKITLVAFI